MTRIPKFGKAKTNVRPRTALRFALIACAIMSIMALSFGSSASRQPYPSSKIKVDNASPTSAGTGLFARLLASFLSPMPPPKANLDQVRNGSFAAPIDPPTWVNGNAGASNSHYREGESIPYRIRLDNLSLGEHTVIIEWDTRHSGVNAIDYITYYDRIAEAVNPLLGLSGTFAAPVFTQIPAPALTDGATIATNSFLALPAAQQNSPPTTPRTWLGIRNGTGANPALRRLLHFE